VNAMNWTTTGGDKVTIYLTEDKQFAWRVRAANGEIVGHGESHIRLTDAIAAAERHHPRVES
jgi:uncharacterized protein YegP (UPF0339 family)